MNYINEYLKNRRKIRELDTLLRNKKTCLICWDIIDENNWTTCIRCNIFLHKGCEERFRANKGYCKCPHCMQIGTMGSPRAIE